VPLAARQPAGYLDLVRDFAVAFTGDLSLGEQSALEQAGFGVHVSGVGTSAAYWPEAGEKPKDWDSRHVVTLRAEDAVDAERKVVDLLGRELLDAMVVP
jgi:hypothetical protein